MKLEVGQRVLTRNNELYDVIITKIGLFLYNKEYGSYMRTDSYNDNLKCYNKKDAVSIHDIMIVYDIPEDPTKYNNRNVLWSREIKLSKRELEILKAYETLGYISIRRSEHDGIIFTHKDGHEAYAITEALKLFKFIRKNYNFDFYPTLLGGKEK